MPDRRLALLPFDLAALGVLIADQPDGSIVVEFLAGEESSEHWIEASPELTAEQIAALDLEVIAYRGRLFVPERARGRSH
jgi:hypothetical protein